MPHAVAQHAVEEHGAASASECAAQRLITFSDGVEVMGILAPTIGTKIHFKNNS